ALTSSGSGRLEILKDATKDGALPDLRILDPLLTGIEARYPELANYIAERVLPAFGSSILPILRERMNHCTPSARPRFQAAIARIDPNACEELCRTALAEG